MGLACHNFHDVYKKFPASVLSWRGAGAQDPANTTQFLPNWVIFILPYMEHEATYEQFQLPPELDIATWTYRVQPTVFISSPVNRVPRGITIPSLRCPSDSDAEFKFAGNNAAEGDNWARSNYGANGANRQLDNCIGPNSTGWANPPDDLGGADPRGKGVMGCNVSLSIAEILDGTSTTMLIGEMRVGLSDQDRRGTWAMGCAGASSLWWHGYGGDCNGPNPQNDHSDDILGCPILISTVGLPRLLKEKMSCWEPCTSKQGTCRSKHPAGVVIALCDGSSRFVGNRVSHTGPWGPCCGAWDRLITSQDGVGLQDDGIAR